MLTALWFQDGGLGGGVFDLALLFLIGSVAERLWRPHAWLLLYLASGLATECLALWWAPVGAGNSIACLGLAGSILVRTRGKAAGWITHAPAAVGLGAGVLLAVERDIHGAAILIGAAAGLLLARLPGLVRKL